MILFFNNYIAMDRTVQNTTHKGQNVFWVYLVRVLGFCFYLLSNFTTMWSSRILPYQRRKLYTRSTHTTAVGNSEQYGLQGACVSGEINTFNTVWLLVRSGRAAVWSTGNMHSNPFSTTILRLIMLDILIYMSYYFMVLHMSCVSFPQKIKNKLHE